LVDRFCDNLPRMDAATQDADFQAAKKLAESLGYRFESDYEFDEWLAEVSEYFGMVEESRKGHELRGTKERPRWEAVPVTSRVVSHCN
jgi:hypothetical protein